jgi:hypothetical protein
LHAHVLWHRLSQDGHRLHFQMTILHPLHGPPSVQATRTHTLGTGSGHPAEAEAGTGKRGYCGAIWAVGLFSNLHWSILLSLPLPPGSSGWS